MRFKMMAFIAAAAIVLPAIAQADDTNPAGASKPKKEKKVCRRETVTGSIIGFRSICHTQDEWAVIDNTNGNVANSTLTQSRQAAAVNGGRPN